MSSFFFSTWVSPTVFCATEKLRLFFLVIYKYFKSQYSPILTNTHRYSPVLASTRHGVRHPSRGAPPLTGCATPHGVRLPDDDCSGLTQVGHQRWNPWRGAAPLHPGTPAPRYPCTQVPLHPGAAPRYCTPGCSNGPQGFPQVRRPAHRGAKMRFPRSARRNKNLTNSMSFRRGTRNSTKNARCSAA